MPKGHELGTPSNLVHTYGVEQFVNTCMDIHCDLAAIVLVLAS